MKGVAIVLILLLLTGCLATTPVPVKPKFPDPVPKLLEECPELSLVPSGTEKLSETISIVSKNYGQYHECRAKINAWIEWYIDQKKIYDEVK